MNDDKPSEDPNRSNYNPAAALKYVAQGPAPSISSTPRTDLAREPETPQQHAQRSARSVWCKDLKTGSENDLRNCDSWPLCGCDPHADKVIEALNESGLYVVPCSGDCEEMIVAAEAFDAEWYQGCESSEEYARKGRGPEYFMGIYEAMVERSQKP